MPKLKHRVAPFSCLTRIPVSRESPSWFLQLVIFFSAYQYQDPAYRVKDEKKLRSRIFPWRTPWLLVSFHAIQLLPTTSQGQRGASSRLDGEECRLRKSRYFKDTPEPSQNGKAWDGRMQPPQVLADRQAPQQSAGTTKQKRNC
jgi:hypothetical protein